jgi:hypothetical protein
LWNKKTEEGEKCNSLAAWDMICRPKRKGGVGILNLRIQNEGLLLKFLHKFYNKDDTPWVSLVWNAYYSNNIPHVSRPCGSFWWIDVSRLSHLFRGIAKSSIGNGATTLFWKDQWSVTILEESHPTIYSYARKEDISVQEFLTADSLTQLFYLPLSPEALAELRDIQNSCREIELREHSHDTWSYVWGDKEFTSSKYYQYNFRNINPHISFKWLWKSKCTAKVKFFGWLILSDRLNTRNMLRRRHYALGTGYDFFMCNHNTEEIIEHLFFHCPFSQDCWSSINISWAMNNSRLQIIEQGKKIWNKKLFMEITLLGSWNIWKERNNLWFNNIQPSVQAWKSRFAADLSLLIHRTKEELHPLIKSIIHSL